ncbi:MAG: HAMP domain-containing histidine kinase [Sandaracinaceae bacterium]|nr:HAMP domain-containing histidine kinase [Sandaracinaceae bacterium]
MAGVYAATGALYIAVSTHLAAAASADVGALTQVEVIKGCVFVGVTAALLFAGGRASLLRIAAHQRELATAHEALLCAERKANTGLLAATVAHDLNNVLTILNVGVEELRVSAGLAASPVLDDLDVAIAQASRLAKRMTTARRPEDETPGHVELVALAQKTLDVVRMHRSVRARSVTLVGEAPVVAEVHPSLFEQVITNLVINAAEATGERGCVEVHVRASLDGARIEVHDDGPGFTDEQQATAFEPFYTTKASGTGLGLFSVRICAQRHGGEVTLARSHLGGACVRLDLRQAGAIPPDEPPSA